MPKPALRCLISARAGFRFWHLLHLVQPSNCLLFSGPACFPLPYYGVTYFFPACGASLVCEISPGRSPVKRHKVSTGDRIAVAKSLF